MNSLSTISYLSRLAAFLIALTGSVAATLPPTTAAETASASAIAPPAPFVPAPSTQPRMIVLISDLHFGLGKRPDGSWSHKEDFRWSGALKGFLDEMGRRGNDHVDLLVVGDFLELWQPPDDIVCDSSADPDLGCTVPEIASIASTVIGAHAADIGILGDFAQRGENRLYVIPGNHDAALLLPEVWSLLAGPLNVSGGHVALMTAGFWKSPDGRVIAEHGHQVGNDANRFDRWPLITRNQKGTIYLERSWGERFVQKLFNSEEEQYEIIDNVSPETVGVKYRVADRGYARSAVDVARFIAFDLFETSTAQKSASLGPEASSNDPNRWNLKLAREQLGYRLFLQALPKGDPLRAEIDGQTNDSNTLQAELNALARDKAKFTDEEVLALCDDLALFKAKQRCAAGTAGAIVESNFVPRNRVVGAHVEEYLRSDKRLRIFVYGHTHEYEKGRPLKMASGSQVIVHNTGAFQRTVDEAGFLSRVKAQNLSPNEALRKIRLEDLPPCYSAVLVTYSPSGAAVSKTWRWLQEEGGTGVLVEPGDNRCN
jgi:hypothetical protein